MQDKLTRLHNISVDLVSEINEKFIRCSFYSLNSIYLQSLFQNKYNATEEMFLFKVSFNSLIKTLSWILSLKLHQLFARIEKSSGQTTVLQTKVHRQLINNCPPFRPILSAIGTLTYNIARFLVPILKPLTTNDYTLKDTFEFSRDILNQNPNLFMASLDVDSLFTNIPLDETINIIIEKLSSENETVHNLNKDQFKCLFTLATKESYFLFDGELY